MQDLVPYEDHEGGYRVSQHFMDALGRETNTVVIAVLAGLSRFARN